MTKRTAIDAFIEHKIAIEAALARLTELADDHFNVSPHEIHWGHVGDLAETAEQLKRITDRHFREGEHE